MTSIRCLLLVVVQRYHWHQWINTTVFLINDHLFSEDRVHEDLVKRFSNEPVTKEDINLFFTRLLNYGRRNGGKLELLNDTSDICYTCEKIMKEIQLLQVFCECWYKKHI